MLVRHPRIKPSPVSHEFDGPFNVIAMSRLLGGARDRGIVTEYTIQPKGHAVSFIGRPGPDLREVVTRVKEMIAEQRDIDDQWRFIRTVSGKKT